MPEPSSPATVRRDRLAVAYWIAVILIYAALGAHFQPFFLLGFWECLPFLFCATWLAARLLPRVVPPPSTRDDPE